MSTINVNLAKCTCPAGWPSGGSHFPRIGETMGCDAEPLAIPCRPPPSFTCHVVLGECRCAEPRSEAFWMTTKQTYDGQHWSACPSRPARVSASITSPDGSWERSEVTEVDTWSDSHGVAEESVVLAAVRDRWALVKALVTGHTDVSALLTGSKAVELLAQRDAVFEAITRAHRAEDELIEALGDYETSMRGEPVGIYGLRRESHGALARYVERVIEHVGAI